MAVGLAAYHALGDLVAEEAPVREEREQRPAKGHSEACVYKVVVVPLGLAGSKKVRARAPTHAH